MLKITMRVANWHLLVTVVELAMDGHQVEWLSVRSFSLVPLDKLKELKYVDFPFPFPKLCGDSFTVADSTKPHT